MKRKCLTCGKEIEVTETQIKNNRGKFCSTKCRYEYKKKPLNKCEICGKGTKNKKYCSNECNSVALGRKKQICPICGDSFYNNRKKYCSKECYTKSQIREKIYKNVCEICGSPHNNKKYCSEKCQHVGSRKNIVERISVKCEECGEEIITIKSQIRGEYKFCSVECFHKNLKKRYKGENNHRYGTIKSEQEKKHHSEIMLELWKNADYANKVKNGIDNYNLNHEYKIGWEPKSIEKRKNTNINLYGVEHVWSSKEIIKKCKETCLLKYGKTSQELAYEGLLKKGKTKIEIIFEDFLNNNNIKYKDQFRIYYDGHKHKRYDFYLIDYNLIVEIDGDYWHGNQLFFKKLNETQKLNIENDIFKNELALKNDKNILRIWEYEIYDKTYIEKIKNIING